MSLTVFILIICIASATSIVNYRISENIISAVLSAPFAMALLVLLATSSISRIVEKTTQITKEETRLEVSLLPNQVVTTDTNTFISQTKELKTNKTKDTSYIQDGKDKPYIVVDKITYSCADAWYLEKKISQKINERIDYELKEVHY